MTNYVSDTKKEMETTLEHLKAELHNIRSGRAHPALVQGVMVDVYGTEMRLQDVANVTAPEARQLLITPFDASNCGAIAKGIEKVNLSVQVVAEANVVRLIIPPMDEQTRKEMVKLCGRKLEEGKVSIRNVRRKYNDQARAAKSASDLTEDELKGIEKKIQGVTDEYCQKADTIAADKEKDIMAI